MKGTGIFTTIQRWPHRQLMRLAVAAQVNCSVRMHLQLVKQLSTHCCRYVRLTLLKRNRKYLPLKQCAGGFCCFAVYRLPFFINHNFVQARWRCCSSYCYCYLYFLFVCAIFAPFLFTVYIGLSRECQLHAHICEHKTRFKDLNKNWWQDFGTSMSKTRKSYSKIVFTIFLIKLDSRNNYIREMYSLFCKTNTKKFTIHFDWHNPFWNENQAPSLCRRIGTITTAGNTVEVQKRSSMCMMRKQQTNTHKWKTVKFNCMNKFNRKRL